MRRLLPLLALALAAPARAQAPRDPARLYSHEAPIELPDARGLVRLPLPRAVLERCRPDLSDLRIHDAASGEHPYLVESGARAGGFEEVLPLEPIRMERRVEDLGTPAFRWREALRVSPPERAAGARWTLLLDSSRPSFVRRVTVYRVDDGARGAELARGTVFRLPGPRRERLFLELPETDAAALEVEVAGEGSYLEPTLRLLVDHRPVEPPVLALPLREVGRSRAAGRTTVELARPPGFVPDRLRFHTGTGRFQRALRVLDLAPGEAPREIGRTTLFRVPEVEGGERLEVELGPARGDALRIEIEDGDSPELEGLRVEALVRQPSLVFESDGGPLVLHLGGGRARPPRYDLAYLARSSVGEALGRAPLPEAALGPVRENPRFEDGPALGFAMHPGRAPDARRFTHVAPLVVSGAVEGLSRVRLPASVLAAARGDLADLRVVDEAGRQWPYLVGALEEDILEARVEGVDSAAGESRYSIELPAARARVSGLWLDTEAAFVSRAFELYGLDERGRRVRLHSGRLARAVGAEGPLELRFPDRRVSRLTLVVEDGSDAPLRFTAVRVAVPSPTLFLAAPDGRYRALVGDPEGAPPRYEVEQARALVLSVRPADARVGEAAPNPAHVEPPWFRRADLATWVLWGVLVLAILLLGVLTLRVARQPLEEDAEAGEGPAPAEAGEAPPSAEEGEAPSSAEGGEAGGGSEGPSSER